MCYRRDLSLLRCYHRYVSLQCRTNKCLGQECFPWNGIFPVLPCHHIGNKVVITGMSQSVSCLLTSSTTHDDVPGVEDQPGDGVPAGPPGPRLPRHGGADQSDGLSVFSRTRQRGRADSRCWGPFRGATPAILVRLKEPARASKEQTSLFVCPTRIFMA